LVDGCPRLPDPIPVDRDGRPSGESSAADKKRGETIRIPLRIREGEKPNIRPSDIILQNGDILHVKFRRGEVFYTGGYLPPRVFPLPRDRDLSVVEAISMVGGPLVNGGIGTNNLTGSLSTSGIGAPSPSLVVILRKTKAGGQVNIRISLTRALRDPREDIRILPGDVVIMQQTMTEALTQYINSQWKFDFFATIIRQRDLTGTSTLLVP
jgi:hypothetical protein